MRFADITGQEDLKRHLVQSVDAGRVSHAQLFTGQAGAGALALAVAYVHYLCCHHRHDGDSCGECPDCRQIAALAHPDLHLVFPVNKQGKKSGEVMRSDEFLPLFRAVFSENGGYFSAQDWYERLDLGKTLKGMIAAREADEIIRKLSFKSFEADYKTMLIWLPETMNEEAANKILKILEEPWDRTLFILVCEHPDRLLPTIVSRTQEVCVPRIAPDVLERVAQQRGVADPLPTATFTIFGLSPAGQPPVTAILGPNARRTDFNVLRPTRGVQAAIGRDNDGWILEARIPWSVTGLNGVANGAMFAANVNVAERQQAGFANLGMMSTNAQRTLQVRMHPRYWQGLRLER